MTKIVIIFIYQGNCFYMAKCKGTNMNNEKTAINESLLQSYRSNMIASQSFLLAVAAAFYEKNDILEMACIFVALFQLWYIWFRVIRVRAIIVDYYKHHLAVNYNNAGGKENNSSNPLTENVYLKNRNIRIQVNRDLAEKKHDSKLKYNFRLTRIKLDIVLPVSFTFMWILMLLDKILL